MKPVKCAVIGERDGNPSLKRIGEGLMKLNEIKGKIIFSETLPTGYGSCLEFKIDGKEDLVRWQEQKNIPLPALVGQIIRGFYECGGYHRNDEDELQRVIYLDGYELQNMQGEVLTRALKSRKYKFIEAE